MMHGAVILFIEHGYLGFTRIMVIEKNNKTVSLQVDE